MLEALPSVPLGGECLGKQCRATVPPSQAGHCRDLREQMVCASVR